MSIKRYTMYPDCMADCYIAHEEDDIGNWVKYIEHERVILAKDEEIAKLRKVVEDVAGFYGMANYKEFIEDDGRKALAALAELDEISKK